MKLFSVIRFGFFLSLFSMLIISCDQDNDPPIVPVDPVASMTCLVEGSSWSAASNMASASILSSTSNVSGINSSSSTITITVNESFVVNASYDLGLNSGNGAAYLSSNNGSSAWISHGSATTGGTVTITGIDTENKLISGTFEFNAFRATDNSYRNISEGQFTALPYSNTVTGPANNVFTVDINGEAFDPAAVNGIILNSNLNIVAANTQATESVSLIVPEDIEAGTYTIGGILSDYSGMYVFGSNQSAISTTGTVTITTHDTQAKFIEGTFNYTASEFLGTTSFELTNGNFAVSY